MATTFLNGDYSRVVPIVSSFFTLKDTQLNVRENYIEFLIADAEIKDKFPILIKELGKNGMVATARKQKYFSRLMPALSSAVRLQIEDGIMAILYTGWSGLYSDIWRLDNSAEQHAHQECYV